MKIGENVMVVKSDLLAKIPEGISDGFPDKIIAENSIFIPRDTAERNKDVRQIIPYILIYKGDKVFATRRLKGSTEKRLHNQISLGIGGHIDFSTEGLFLNKLEAMTAGMLRELNEEVDITGSYNTPISVACINDKSEPVSRLHIGNLYLLEVSGDVFVKEKDKLEGFWITVNELAEMLKEANQLEGWARLAAEFFLYYRRCKYHCPKCGCTKFEVITHVTQEWEIDRNGNFVKCNDNCMEVTHSPNDDDLWICTRCGYEDEGKFFRQK